MNTPLMSRIDEEARKYAANFEGNSVDAKAVARHDFVAGAQFVLTELSRASEGEVYPRLQVLKSSLDGHNRLCTAFRFTDDSDDSECFVPRAELLAARAAHAELDEKYIKLACFVEDQRLEICARGDALTAATTARESAEARVAALTEALKKILKAHVDKLATDIVTRCCVSYREAYEWLDGYKDIIAARQALSPEEQR